MNIIGIYHSKCPQKSIGICDAPHMLKGSMVLCAEKISSQGAMMGCIQGRLRNRTALCAELGLERRTPLAEILLTAYARWGMEYPKHMEGAVCTALLDEAEDVLVLSRDRMGERPVFYASRDGSIAFSDHPDAILLTGVAEPVIDIAGARELFGLGPARTPGKTPYRDIQSLEAGCILIAKNGAMRIEQYFALEAHAHTDGEAETILRVRTLLESAVNDLVPLHPCTMLSGGLDSTVLTALLKRRLGRLYTFSVSYAGDDEDFQANSFRPSLDAPYVRMAAKALNTQHTFVTLSQEALADTISTAAEARGFAGMADVDASMLLFAHNIAKQSRDVVSGECSDEVFGGYPWFRDAGMFSEDVFPWSGSMELREGILKAETREKLGLREFVRDTLSKAIAEAPKFSEDSPEDARLRTTQSLCLRFFMPNLQERAVRMCEHAGIDVWTPYSDERLVQYVFNVPWDMKRMNGMEKGLLRQACADLLPKELLWRKKSPYPKTCSPVFAERMRRRMREVLSDAKSPILEVLDVAMIEKLMSTELKPTDAPWFGQLMAGSQMLGYLIQINDWMRARSLCFSF